MLYKMYIRGYPFKTLAVRKGKVIMNSTYHVYKLYIHGYPRGTVQFRRGTGSFSGSG